MVTDQEPRYRLVDADGNVVGSLFAETDGTLKLQEGTSGNDNEVSLTTQGALELEQLSPASLSSDNTDPTNFYRATGDRGTILTEEWSSNIVADGSSNAINREADAGMFLVHGTDSQNNEFFDVVNAQCEGGVGFEVQSKIPTTTPPADRSYGIQTGDLTVSISDGGSTYGLTVRVVGVVQ